MTSAAPELDGYRHLYSGKVRDLYAPVGADGQPLEDRLLLVASDRLSAFDHVLRTPIPDKGRVLTQLSLWWFEQLEDLVPHHVLASDGPEIPASVAGRAVLVRRLEMVPVECVARAYLTGGGLREYVETGTVSGVRLPEGLVDGDRLPEPVFTPSSKAPAGQHDEPIDEAQVDALVGEPMRRLLSSLTTRILARGNEIATERGVIIADTKVEFGLAPGSDPADPQVVLADEVLTPDSSRFWPVEGWEPGHTQPSYDKEFVREWLLDPATGWDRHSGEAPPPMPEAIALRTRAKYVEAYERLTGRTFS
ncbi:phosphoribosylaminoimidazolesuccinocarboxamide synthase [Lapillicoccus jejuensis]|uniref:Phosphoribosylaminoimidazole-succinocarboxamide synthase n=1 Tax=Lapillicoccus jejuensis TaxID=402171 RepID=A0A542E0E1_9MICO|nr:phosphoribosylaminoimidazolesuccinocarboxamide synthase [Lapillicoccus jejuensis]TQJ08749.1 phosphoribosylaminoimidazole-succinocarboxamide synthase [Lapillicoccus jejuensis]